MSMQCEKLSDIAAATGDVQLSLLDGLEEAVQRGERVQHCLQVVRDCALFTKHFNGLKTVCVQFDCSLRAGSTEWPLSELA